MFYYDIQEPYRDELLTAVKSLTEARYAIAAVYVLQLYEWVAWYVSPLGFAPNLSVQIGFFL